MNSEKVYIVSKKDYWETDFNDGCLCHWVFRDKEKAEKFIELQYKNGDRHDYELDEEVYEDDFLEFNSDKSDLLGRCLTVTKEGDEFKSEIEVMPLNDLMNEFGCCYKRSRDNKNKEKIPNWLKYEECSEIEERLKKEFKEI